MDNPHVKKMKHAEEYADNLVELTRNWPEKLIETPKAGSKWKTIYQKLADIYIEESKIEPKCKKLLGTSHLLDKLVKRDHLNTLVVNLYPGNDGYSLMLKGRNGADSETIRLPYEEAELLEYIDAEELPPLLVDLLDKAQASIFYCGCVVVELRDHRRATNNSFDTRFILLKPTSHTLLCDINALTSDGHRWTQEDKLQLESELLLEINSPVCLDPSPAVFFLSCKMNEEKHRLHSHALKRSMCRYSQSAVNRKRKFSQCAAPLHLKLHDFVTQRRDKLKASPPVNLKIGKSEMPIVPKTCVDMWRQRDVQLTMPEKVEVERFAKILEKPTLSAQGNTPVVVEEYTFETERSHGKVNYSKLTVRQRMSDEFYYGELYVDRDYVEGHSRGSTCKFPLRTKANVEKYIRQFKEIFTEEGRRQVKIIHQMPGQKHTVTYTPTLHSSTPVPAAPANPAQPTLITQATNLAATITGQLGLASNSGDKRAPPIRLSLQLNPQVAGVSGTNLLSPQGATLTSPGQPTAQLTLNLHQQPLTNTQRIRQMALYPNLQQRASSQSPATTPTASGFQSAASAPGTPSSVTMATTLNLNHHAKGLAVTAPPAALHSLGTHTPTTASTPRRSTADGQFHHQIMQGQGGSAPPTPSTPGSQAGEPPQPPSTPSGSQSQLTSNSQSGSTPPPNVNITNIAGLTPNISIQSLAGMGITNLQNLQNVQVSLGTMPLPSGMSLPVTVSMINAALVSSLSNAQSSGRTSVTSSTGQSSNQTKTNISNVVSSSQNLVSMATGSTPAVAMASNSSAVNVTSGLITTPTSVLSAQGGMLSLPIGVAGNLTQFMAGVGFKGAPGIKPGTPLLLSQLPPGQQGMQLLSAAGLHQARTAGISTASGKSVTTASPISTALLTPHPLGPQAAAGLPQLRAAASGALPQQQLVQLTQQQQQQLQQLALQQQQKMQQQQQQLAKQSKSRKRTTPTPPKS